MKNDVVHFQSLSYSYFQQLSLETEQNTFLFVQPVNPYIRLSVETFQTAAWSV